MTLRTAEYLATPTAADNGSSVSNAIADETQRELVLLTQRLFFKQGGPHLTSMLIAGVDERSPSSLWVATGVAAILGRLLEECVHVLALGSDVASQPVPAGHGNSGSPTFVLERIGQSSREPANSGVLSDRLATLAANGDRVIVHLPGVGRNVDLLARMKSLDGVVLLIRGSHTRRESLRAAERTLASVSVPVLGIVLLNRTYPIPEKLYRLL